MEGTRYIQVILPLRLEWEPCYALPEGMDVCVGDRVRVVFAHAFYIACVSRVDVTPELDPERIQPIEAKEEALPAISEQEIRFWRALAAYYLCGVGEVYKAAYPAMKNHQSRLQAPGNGAEPQDVTLSALQEEACASIRAGFAAGKPVLLHGVTGSGKTEIYLRLSVETLRQGRSVLYLVPEIALSRQLEERIAAVVPGVLVYHSAETDGRKKLVAREVRSGRPVLVLGTRSALLLPHRNLGLVIVDEEHDTSYKQDAPAPRYHARESAILLSVIQGAAVLLGSATPSLESLYNTEIGRFIKVELNERFYTGEEAELRIIDTIAERRKGGMAGSLSRKLLAEIRRTLDAGEQVLLLRSRRSYAPAVQCEECGDIPHCPHCNVSLSLHKYPNRLVCHYCGHSQPFTGTCTRCGGALQPLGAGTQRVEEELLELFPEARIGRLDADVAAGEDADVVQEFAAGNLDILVGTQMVTKGFDFDKLRLVAVIQADNILGQQDFRADERAFQLLEQFRGRSGRRGSRGLFIIQTREPAHPVFDSLDGRPQLDALLRERRIFGYPPYTRLIHIVLKDKALQRLEHLATELAERLAAEPGLSGMPIVGPYAPVVDRIADQHIRQLRIMLPRDKSLPQRKEALAAVVHAFEKEKRYIGHLAVDVDPV